MTGKDTAHLIPYFISLAIIAGALAYTWSKRHIQGANAFGWYGFGLLLWIIALIFEEVNTNIYDKVLWENVQWLASAFVIFLPIFAIQFTEYKTSQTKTLIQAAAVVTVAFLFLLSRDSYLQTIAPYTGADSFNMAARNFKIAFWAYMIYRYALALAGFAILFRKAIRQSGWIRAQIELIALGFFISAIGSFPILLKTNNIAQYTIAPFSFAVGSLIVAWSLFRLRFFESAPLIARDKVFEAMVEPVVILDNDNIIVDINTSLLDLMGEKAINIIGKPAKEVFEGFPIPIKQYIQTKYASAEAIFELGKKEIHYEMTVWPMYDTNKKIAGRIFISHDITAFKELERELRKLNAQLEDRVRARTHELKEAYDITLEGWARALELRDKETEGHTRRVTDLTLKIASRMNIEGEELDHVRRGAILHDIGKMGIADNILLKPGSLTKEERAIIERHPQMAYSLLLPIPFLKKALDIPYYHHEKWDGTGYPHGLKGEEIPLAARIFAVVDVWDALNSERPYKKKWALERTKSYMIEQSGRHFDPKVVNMFLDMLDKGEI